MSLSSQEVSHLVGLGLPVLCVDTCTVLDVVRDITRETVTTVDVNAGFALLSMAEAGSDLIVLMAEQVTLEIASNVSGVEQEAQVALQKFLAQAQRIHDVAMAFGAQGNLQVRHLDGHVGRALPVLDRWKQVAQLVPHNDGVASRAFRRVNEPRTPARRGKESMKDCVIVEAYIEAASQLRAVGMTAPIVFASSNPKVYFALNNMHLQGDIAQDLGVVGIEFAPNFSAAKHNLGL